MFVPQRSRDLRQHEAVKRNSLVNEVGLCCSLRLAVSVVRS